MRSEQAPGNPPGDAPTPAALREGGLTDATARQFLDWFQPRLHAWARSQLGRWGITDRATAEDLVQHILMKLIRNWSYEPEKGRLSSYLYKAICWAALDEVQRRQARRADYGASPADKDLLQALQDSVSGILQDVDTEWQRQRQAVRAALRRVCEQVTPREWEVFYLKNVKDLPARKVAQELNRRHNLSPALELGQVYRITYKVCEIFKGEFQAAGIDPHTSPQSLEALCAELGGDRPGSGPRQGDQP